MKCPSCGTALHFQSRPAKCVGGRVAAFEERVAGWSNVNYPELHLRTELMNTPCPECGYLIVMLRLVEYGEYAPGQGGTSVLQEHVIFPPRAWRVLPEEVPERLRKDFQEAASVVDLSPKASAALGRRILQDVLRDECGCVQRDLSKQVEEFAGRPGTPSSLREQLDALREIGNFAAHTQKDTNTGEVLDVEPGEAEWLLETLEELFDHVYVMPAKRTARLAALNEKLAAAGRKPLAPETP